MTDDERIARLTELARKAWPDRTLEVTHCAVNIFDEDTVEVQESVGADLVSLFAITHPRALDALEAALLVLAGEPPYLAVALRDAMDRVENQNQMLRVVGQHAREVETRLDAMVERLKTLGPIIDRLETQADGFAKVGKREGELLAETYRAYAADLRAVCRPLEGT